MKTRLIATVATLLIITGGIEYIKKELNEEATNEKCCLSCPKKGEVKYYSIDKKHDLCGESCLNPKVYWIYKIFESGLTLAQDKNCSTLGYPKYMNTVSHGVYPIKVAVDMYEKSK